MRIVGSAGQWVVLLALVALGCSGDGGSRNKPSSFDSELPDPAAVGGESSGPPGAPGASSPSDAAPPPGAASTAAARPDEDDGVRESRRAIAEADLIQLHGNLLYVFSEVAGLAIVDVRDPRALRLVGRYREVAGTPYEMFVRDNKGVAEVLFSGKQRYVENVDGVIRSEETSKLLTLDVRDPTNVARLGSFELPGRIIGSRRVGDVLYVVHQNEVACWDCTREVRTAIVSVSLGDPRNVTKIDEVAYVDAGGTRGVRSAALSEARVYLARPDLIDGWPNGSTINVLDISDAAGDIVEGATVHPQGVVDSSWQMDEFQGVLRVLSQPPDGPRVMTHKPAIETFAIESSQALRELGYSELQLPESGTLRQARFDGVRGYVGTSEYNSAQITLDLSDPAEPKQAGELRPAGDVYHLEPRGERLIGVSMERGDAGGGLTVSLFDVKNIAEPTELSRVSFGVDAGWGPGDLSHFHSMVRALGDAGLLPVPFVGLANHAPGPCYGEEGMVGGLQLIHVAHDELKSAGAALSRSDLPSRGLLVGGTLISVGPQNVETFDVDGRDEPGALSEVSMSQDVVRAALLDNDVVARIFVDHARDDYQIDFTRDDQAADPNQRLAQVNLEELLVEDHDACETRFVLEQTFVRGRQLELLFSGSTRTPERVFALLVIDANNPQKPQLAAQVRWRATTWAMSYGFESNGAFGYAPAIVRTEHALALLESDGTVDRARLRVLDLRDLSDVKNTLIPIEARQSIEGLVADGEMVMTSHFEPSAAGSRRGKFYVDRIDLADPAAPRVLAKINVPGALVSFDAKSRRALTAEQVRSGQRLHLVELNGDLAVEDDQRDLPPDEQIFAVRRGDGVVFASVAHNISRNGCSAVCRGGNTRGISVLALGGFEQGRLLSARIELETSGEDLWFGPVDWPAVYTDGKRALIAGRELVLLDASDVDQLEVRRRLPAVGSVEFAELHGERALLTVGESFGKSFMTADPRGAAWIDLGD